MVSYKLIQRVRRRTVETGGPHPEEVHPKMSRQRRRLPPYDRYAAYLAAVQCPETDMGFVDRAYRRVNGGKKPRILREDFCGTFANCCRWVRMGADRVAHGLDLDPEPLAWGRSHNWAALKPEQQARVVTHRANVLAAGLPRADAICALNFSYFTFKDRKTLGRYFAGCRRSLRPGGVLVLDCFGGSACMEPSLEKSVAAGSPPFTYMWEQVSYCSLTAHAKFAIHFKRPGERERRNQFTYDWRMWSPSELKDLLHDCGFSAIETYWEGTTADGEGDGRWRPARHGEPCQAFITYIVASR